MHREPSAAEKTEIAPPVIPPMRIFADNFINNELIARVEPCGTFRPHPEGKFVLGLGLFILLIQERIIDYEQNYFFYR